MFWQTERGGGCSERAQPENGVLMCGPNSKKGVLGAAAPPPPPPPGATLGCISNTGVDIQGPP